MFLREMAGGLEEQRQTLQRVHNNGGSLAKGGAANLNG
jgi:hypothetical protein